MGRVRKRIAILGGGPSGLFVFKRLLESERQEFIVDIFEAKNRLGAGMPYSEEGSNLEHITNVSGNEIPELVTSVVEWLNTLSDETLQKFNLTKSAISDYKVLPRLLFGAYLTAQFELLLEKAAQAGLRTQVNLNCRVTDIMDDAAKNTIGVEIEGGKVFEFDHVVVCTGHNWPRTKEGLVDGYFDSPYPPAKLARRLNHRVAVRGSSLTAIDAVRTLARNNGDFVKNDSGGISFLPHKDAEAFKIMMYSRNGLLPCVRFHLADPHLSKESLLSPKEIAVHRAGNGGFVSLDFIFEKDFKDAFREKEPAFYSVIRDMSMEQFVDAMMGLRESVEPFAFFKAEYEEARQSIRRHESIYWKEMLAVLSFAMNYPAKHFSAEDMLRLQQVLMPLISIVIAFAPQSSCEELIALHAAGRLELVGVGSQSHVEAEAEGGISYHLEDETGRKYSVRYQTFVDCIGQPHLLLDAFPFPSLVKKKVVSAALLKFRSAERALQLQVEGNKNVIAGKQGEYLLKVPGITITDNFEAVGATGSSNPRLYIMAVPYIGGFNPDYSGLDFCEEASRLIVDAIAAQKS